MRKFILTSPKLTGQIEVIFHDDAIVCIDFRQCQVEETRKEWLLQRVPVKMADLEAFIKGTGFTCVESDIELTFEMFWNKYGMKVDRKRTLAIWEKLSKSKQVAAYYGIEKYDRYLKRTDWRNKCEPKTYLINERWENEWR